MPYLLTQAARPHLKCKSWNVKNVLLEGPPFVFFAKALSQEENKHDIHEGAGTEMHVEICTLSADAQTSPGDNGSAQRLVGNTEALRPFNDPPKQSNPAKKAGWGDKASALSYR